MAVPTVTPTAVQSSATGTPASVSRTPMASVTPTAAHRTPTATVQTPTGDNQLRQAPARVPSSVSTTSQPTRVASGPTPSPPGCGLFEAAIGSFFGALGGAAVVLFIEWRRRRKDDIAQEVEGLRRTQFDLSRRLAALDVVHEQWLSPAMKSHGGHWAALQPIPGMVLPEPMQLEHVGFLLEKGPGLLESLHRADLAFQSYKSLVTDFLAARKEATVVMEVSLGGAVPAQLSLEDVTRHAGPRLDVLLKSMAPRLYSRLSEVKTVLEAVFEEVGRRIETSYGKKPLRLAARREPF